VVVHVDSRTLATAKLLEMAADAVSQTLVCLGTLNCGSVLNQSTETTTVDEQTASDGKPSLADPDGARHILDSDETGGGHRAGTGKPGKSEFPPPWSDEKILGEISDVATDPDATRTPGRHGRTIVRGARDGIEIEVVIGYDGRIITGYPTNVPRNPR
jgi:hypothetical protein